MATDLKPITSYVSEDEAQAIALLAAGANRTFSQYTRLVLQDHIAATLEAERAAHPSRKD